MGPFEPPHIWLKEVAKPPMFYETVFFFFIKDIFIIRGHWQFLIIWGNIDTIYRGTLTIW
jgi:hypothetical protein